jgi:hypothetical protein
MFQHFDTQWDTLPVNVCHETAKLKKLAKQGSLDYISYIFCIGRPRGADRSMEESSQQQLLDFS